MLRIAVLVLALVFVVGPVLAEQGPGHDDLIFAAPSAGTPTVEDQQGSSTGLLALPALVELSERADHLVRSYRRFTALAAESARNLLAAS